MRVQLAAATILTSALLLPAAVSGQEATGTDATKTPATEMQSADMQFVKDAAAAGMAEVEIGKLAVEKADHPAVKQFGQSLVDDHTKANDQLMQIAEGKSIDVPADLSPDAVVEKDRLAALSGSEFDREFIPHMVAGHERAIELFTTESQNGQDPEFKQFAEQTLPTLREHLDEAKRIEANLQQVAGSEQPPEQQTEPAAGAVATDTAPEQPMTTGGTTAESTAAPSTTTQPATEPTATGSTTAESTTAPSTTTQPTTEPTATQEAARPVYPLGDKTADDLIGRKIVNLNGEEVGEIADIVLDANDRAIFAVVSVGGFLGFGEKNVTVPFDQLEPSDTDALLMSSATEEQLKSLPEYQEGGSYTTLPHDRPISEGAQ